MAALWVEKLYLNRGSPRLERFVWKNSDVANCRCPFCGDSDKRTSKARGYFFMHRKDGIFRWHYKCHNCGVGYHLRTFIKTMWPDLFAELLMDELKEKGQAPVQKPTEAVPARRKVALSAEVETNTELQFKNAFRLDRLPEQHIARQYVESRGIAPIHYGKFWWTDFWHDMVCEVTTKHDRIRNESRLVLPLQDSRGKVFGLVGRSLDLNSQRRYMMVRDEESELPSLYGLFGLNPHQLITVVEGPIDSLFIPNSVAMCGGGVSIDMLRELGSRVRVCLDNQPRNRDVVKRMQQYADAGLNLVIWNNMTERLKDINDMASAGLDVNYEMAIRECVGTLFCRIKINEWKRI